VDQSTQPNSSAGAITLISLPKAASNSLKKTDYDVELITATNGGKLSIAYNYQSTKGPVNVQVSLNIPGGALQYDQYLTMALDEATLSGSVFVNTIFGPHGTTFLVPALLNIHATGLDLSSLPSNVKVQLYYYNPDINTYTLMVTKSTNYNLTSGMIKCQDGQLPHFSRYAFGYVK
jgi:hypothetical protein